MKLLKTLCIVIGALLATIPSLAQSTNKSGDTQTADADQIPRLLSYQGVLHDNEGNAVADGSYVMTFTLYENAESADALWSETRQVALAGGVFHANLGSVNALLLPFDRAYWLGIAVGEAGELAPRIALTATAYSFMALTVADGAVTAHKLAPGSVTGSALADNSVTATKIHPDIDIATTGTIQAGSFTGDGSGLTGLPVVNSLNGLRDNVSLVAGDNIGLTQSDSTIVISALINAGEGTISGITAGEGLTGGGTAGVVTLAVAEGGVTSSMLADSAVTAGKLAPGAVTGSALADSSVTATRIHPDIDIATTGTIQAGSFTGDGSGLTGLPAGEISLPFIGEVNSGSAAFSVINTSASGTTYGVSSTSQSTSGRGVFGRATANSGITYGVEGVSQSPDGRGVRGQSTATSGTTYGVEGLSNSTNGTGVFGQVSASSGTTYGVEGLSRSTDGRGVLGFASATSGTTVGVYGFSRSPDGRGVYGEANATSGTTYGVFGQSRSTAGRGVYGWASATSGVTTGVYGFSRSPEGRGVFGWASAASGTTFGVEGRSSSTAGRGVYGEAFAASGITYGIWGESQSPDGRGVFGFTTATSGATRGVYGRSNSTDGSGVYGWASASSGKTFAVRGSSNSSDGFSAYFTGVAGSKNYFQRGVGIGIENPGTFLLAVNGNAAKPGGGSWSAFSDKRLKNDIRPLDNGSLDRLLSINGYTFEYLDEAIENRLALPGRQTGLIAQEVLEVFPDWVDTDDEGYLYVTERGLTALLIEALRELRQEKDAQITALIREKLDLQARLEREKRELASRLEHIEAALGIPSPTMKTQN